MFYYKVVWYNKYKNEECTETGIVAASSYKKAVKMLASKKTGYGKKVEILTLIKEKDKIISYSDFTITNQILTK